MFDTPNFFVTMTNLIHFTTSIIMINDFDDINTCCFNSLNFIQTTSRQDLEPNQKEPALKVGLEII